MRNSNITLGLVLCTLALPVSAQGGTGHYSTGSDFMMWPGDTPLGLSKMAGANVTPDDIDDAFALHGSALYLVHAPAMFPRWELIANAVTDFVVVQRSAATQGAVFSTPEGLQYVSWNAGAPQIVSIAAGLGWANATKLTALTDEAGSTAIAGYGASGRVLRGRWNASGVWTTGFSVKESATDLVLFNYTAHATGIELATIVNGALLVRAESGNQLSIPTLPATPGHRIFRNPQGGTGGLDTLCYVAASTLVGTSFETIQEVFFDGASATLETGPWIIGAAVAARPWLGGDRGMILQAVNTGDVFRLVDVGTTANVLTLVPWASPVAEQDYWHIAVTADELDLPVHPQVLDGLLASADFDADGLDDVLVASRDQRHSYFFPAWDHADRFNALANIDVPAPLIVGRRGRGGNGGSGGPDSTTVLLDISVTVNSLPRGFSAVANGLEVVAWKREGGLSSYVTPVAEDTVVKQAGGSGPTFATVEVSTNQALDQTLCYLELRAVNADFTVMPPVVNQRGSPVNCVTVLDLDPVANPVLCSLFDTEPDRYSEENRSQNSCVGVAGPVILGGYNRRSNIGPFQSGQGSPGF